MDRETNAQYLGLSMAQYAVWEQLLDTPTKDYPSSLQAYIKTKVKRMGMCMEVVYGGVAEWIKLTWDGSEGDHAD